MQITETERFRKSLKNLPSPLKKTIQKQFVLFLKNLFHPSLHTEKLIPKEKNLWSFRINKNIRVIFTFQDKKTILLLDIGPHDIYKKLR